MNEEKKENEAKKKKKIDRHAVQFFLFTLSEEKLFSVELSFFFNVPLIIINPLQAHFIKKKKKRIRVKKLKATNFFFRWLIFSWEIFVLFSRYVGRISH